MPVQAYTPVNGRILSITTSAEDCCQKQLALLTDNGPVNLLLTPDTYVVNSMRLRVGMQITAFYDSSLPVPLIYPPQYRPVIITGHRANEMVTVNWFDPELLAADASLQLNLASSTEVVSANGQPFTCSPGNHNLIVYYTSTTRSLPPQTTPRKIIVLC